MSIFNKFKTNKKTFTEKMEALEKWELERNGSDEKLNLWSLYTRNTKSSKTLDPMEAKFIGVNIPRRRTKPRRKITRYDNNIYTFTYNKKNFYFDIHNIQKGAYRNPRSVKVD